MNKTTETTETTETKKTAPAPQRLEDLEVTDDGARVVGGIAGATAKKTPTSDGNYGSVTGTG